MKLSDLTAYEIVDKKTLDDIQKVSFCVIKKAVQELP